MGCVSVVTSQQINIPTIPTINLNDDSVMYIKGQIYDTHVRQLRKRQKTLKYLVLNSPGGGVDNAYNISLMVKYNGIITVIPPKSRCSSACTLIFQAGKERHASKTSLLMYHGVRLGVRIMKEYFKNCPSATDKCMKIYKTMMDIAESRTIEAFDHLEANGLSHEVYQQFIKLPPDPNWLKTGNLTGFSNLYLTIEEAVKYNAVTKLIEYILVPQ